MNKQELISRIAEDTGLTKTTASAAVESFIAGVTRSLKKGQPITFVRHVQDGAAQSANGAQSADRRRDQDSEAPRGSLHGRQGAQDGRQLAATAHKGQGRKPFPRRFALPLVPFPLILVNYLFR